MADTVFVNFKGWPAGISGGASNRETGMHFVAQEIAHRVPHGARLLDVGCANGEFFDVLRSQNSTWQLFGNDPDPKWLQHDYGDAQVIHQPLRQCNFPDQSFDVVTVLDALYYIPDPDLEIMEIARILKPGGIFIFDVIGQTYLILRGWLGRMLNLERTHTFTAYPFYYSDYSLRLMLNRAMLMVDSTLPNQGIKPDGRIVRLAMAIYMLGLRALTLISPQMRTLSPKNVYIAHRI
ncbi:MAG: class I SAM-dependent methyltransferase [Anaerolineae bacterium]|nr:class I SAM-dependent methyltransferase [Anaerolineae bacterium]